jgi:hypothetical protein
MNQTKDSEQTEPLAHSMPHSQDLPNGTASDNNNNEPISAVEDQEVVAEDNKSPIDQPMEEDSVNPATVFTIRLRQSKANLMHKMSVPELCRNFRLVKGNFLF